MSISCLSMPRLSDMAAPFDLPPVWKDKSFAWEDIPRDKLYVAKMLANNFENLEFSAKMKDRLAEKIAADAKYVIEHVHKKLVDKGMFSGVPSGKIEELLAADGF